MVGLEEVYDVSGGGLSNAHNVTVGIRHVDLIITNKKLGFQPELEKMFFY